MGNTYYDKTKQRWFKKPYIKYACGYCGKDYDTTEEALACCNDAWGYDKPSYTKITSCCYAEIGARTEREYPLGRNEPGYIDYEVPCCTECGKELDE